MQRTDVRLKSPDRNPAVKRRATVDKDSPAKRLITWDEGDNISEAEEADSAPRFEMNFGEPQESEVTGGASSSGDVIGFFKGLNRSVLTAQGSETVQRF